jgi:Transposase IS116/IS110/IS902 family
MRRGERLYGPGDDESAGVFTSRRSPKGNRQMRRILNQCANAAVRTNGSIFEIVYRRLGHNQTVGAIANRLCRLIWINLHPRDPLRGTRPGRLRKVDVNTRSESDPAAPKPRLPRGTVDCSSQPSMRTRVGGGIFAPARDPDTPW